ncbi:MAG: hypothetical protein ACK8QZ_04050, partial [Anaerolineales bacterium]
MRATIRRLAANQSNAAAVAREQPQAQGIQNGDHDDDQALVTLLQGMPEDRRRRVFEQFGISRPTADLHIADEVAATAPALPPNQGNGIIHAEAVTHDAGQMRREAEQLTRLEAERARSEAEKLAVEQARKEKERRAAEKVLVETERARLAVEKNAAELAHKEAELRRAEQLAREKALHPQVPMKQSQ